MIHLNLNFKQMKTKTLLSLLALAGTMFFASCEKDPSPLSKEEAVTKLTSVSTDFAAATSEFNVTPGKMVQSAFDVLPPAFTGAPKKVASRIDDPNNELINSIKPYLSKTNGDGFMDFFLDFEFTTNAGTWTYNANTGWSRNPNSTDKIILVFPYNGGTATFTYSEYQTKTIGSETYLSHLKFTAVLSGQTTPVNAWEYTANRTLTGGSAKFVYSIGKFTKTEAYTLNLSISETAWKMSFTMLVELKKEGSVIFSQSATVVMNEGQTGSTGAIIAKLRVMDIVIEYRITQDPNTNMDGDPSKYMTVTVSTAGGAKIADVVFLYDNTSQQWLPNLKYADGTIVPVKDALNAALLEFIDEFLGTFMG